MVQWSDSHKMCLSLSLVCFTPIFTHVTTGARHIPGGRFYHEATHRARSTSVWDANLIRRHCIPSSCLWPATSQTEKGSSCEGLVFQYHRPRNLWPTDLRSVGCYFKRLQYPFTLTLRPPLGWPQQTMAPRERLEWDFIFDLLASLFFPSTLHWQGFLFVVACDGTIS